MFKDLTNKNFGRWTVQYRAKDRFTKGGYRRTFWHCECGCENKTERDVAANLLLSGASQSCGCLQKENVSKASLKRHFKNRTKYDLTGNYGIGYTYDKNYFYFDKEDYEKIKNYNWFKNDQNYFLARISDENKKCGSRCIRLHRIIMDVEEDDKIEIDHIHGKDSRYDNRKGNLRYATHSQNNQNKDITKRNTSGVTGVDYLKSIGKWRARISKNKITYNLGYFDNFEEATKARKDAEDKYHKEWSYKKSIAMEI